MDRASAKRVCVYFHLFQGTLQLPNGPRGKLNCNDLFKMEFSEITLRGSPAGMTGCPRRRAAATTPSAAPAAAPAAKKKSGEKRRKAEIAAARVVAVVVLAVAADV